MTPLDPRSRYAEAAVRAGLVRPGEPINESLANFAHEIVTIAACIANVSPSPSCDDDTAGDANSANPFIKQLQQR